MPFTENLAPYFANFGEDGTLAGLPVRVIFDAPYEFASLGMAGQASAEPGVTIASLQVPAANHGALLVLARGSYRVREHRPDGTGMSQLMLERA